MPFPFPPEDKPWPYELHGQRPFEPPTILGVRTRTEFAQLSESNLVAGISPGSKYQFTRNSVVTGISIYVDHWKPEDTFFDTVQITKDGQSVLFTDGVNPSDISPIPSGFQNSIHNGGVCPCFIPVDAGEIWTANLMKRSADTTRYLIQLRVERLLAKPKAIPDWLPGTVFYNVKRELQVETTASEELHFRADGVVSGICFYGDRNPAYAEFTNVGTSVLLEGVRSLVVQDEAADEWKTVDTHGFGQPRPFWEEVLRKEKWQVRFRNDEPARVRRLGFFARVEERRRPWERW